MEMKFRSEQGDQSRRRAEEQEQRRNDETSITRARQNILSLVNIEPREALAR